MTNDLKTRVEDNLYERVNKIADEDDVSMAEVQRRAIEQYVGNYESDGSNNNPEAEHPDTLEAVLELDLTDAPHDISVERDADVDWTDSDVVSRTYQQRLLVINAWLNSGGDSRVDLEIVDEMIFDDDRGFGMSDPTLYADRDRLMEYGIASPSPVVDTDWDTDDLLRRVINLKQRDGDMHGPEPDRLDDVLDHNIPDGDGGQYSVWGFDDEFFLSDELYVNQLRGFLYRVRTLMEAFDIDTTTHRMYKLVLEDYLDYLNSKGLIEEDVVETRAWLDDHMETEVSSSTTEKMDKLVETQGK